MSNPVARVVAYLLLAILGAAVGVTGAFLHALGVDVGPVELPMGLVLALAGSGGLFVGGGVLTLSRIGAIASGVGWLVAVLAASTVSPGGDVVLPQSHGSAYVYLLVGTLLVAVAATMPYSEAARRES